MYPLYAVFAYTSDSRDRDEFERLEQQVSGGRNFIRLIGVLDKGVWSNKEGVYFPTVPDSGEISVKFLMYLLNRLEEVAESRGQYRLQEWLQ